MTLGLEQLLPCLHAQMPGVLNGYLANLRTLAQLPQADGVYVPPM